MPLNKDLLPLRAWPPDAYTHEPAHGFFVRLAARNGAHSTAVFADSVGLNGRNPDIEELLEFCQRFPVRGRDLMFGASPRAAGNHIVLNGQKFHRLRDWSMTKPRACGACLAEGRYYRNWWDLAVIARCPIHDRPLSGGNGLSRLRWWYPEVGQTTDGHDLTVYGVASAGMSYPTWDAYVLGRLGITEPIGVPFLDQSDLCDVIDLADLVGRALSSGWRQRAPHRPKFHSDERRHLLSLAFTVLQKGESGLENFLETYLGPDVHARKRQRGVSFFGWFGESYRFLPATELATQLRGVMNLVAAKKGVHSKRGQAPLGKIHTLKDVSKLLGLGTVPLLRIAINLGLTQRTRNRQLRHWFDDAALALIRSYLGSLVSIQAARSILGVSPEEFGALWSIGEVSEALRAKAGYMFDPNTLIQLLENMERHEFAHEVFSKLERKNCLLDSDDRSALMGKLHADFSGMIGGVAGGVRVPSGRPAVGSCQPTADISVSA